MSDLLEALKRLDAEATPGPWASAAGPGESFVISQKDGRTDLRLFKAVHARYSDLVATADLRNALPAIIAALEENERLKAELDRATRFEDASQYF